MFRGEQARPVPGWPFTSIPESSQYIETHTSRAFLFNVMKRSACSGIDLTATCIDITTIRYRELTLGFADLSSSLDHNAKGTTKIKD